MTVWIRMGANVLEGTTERARFELHLSGEPTVQIAIEELLRIRPIVGPRLSRAVFAVGGRTVDSRFILHDGDEVAVIVPVAGGNGSPRFCCDRQRRSQMRRSSNGR
jgi:molybdopterin converting factor small subunit